MTIVLTIIHVLVCVFLVMVVLLQSGKAADLAGAFGGMGSQTAFGPRGAATALSKATTIAAALFMVTSLSLAILATKNSGGTGSVLERTSTGVKKSAPAAAGTPATAPATTPGATPNNAQPMVELFDPKTGEVKSTQPLDIDKLPKVDPNSKAPVIPAPATPAKK
jgi:preprotein translocase subunit SecG